MGQNKKQMHAYLPRKKIKPDLAGKQIIMPIKSCILNKIGRYCAYEPLRLTSL